MRRIFLVAMTLAFSTSSLADQALAQVELQKSSNLLGMTLIEGKNREIMSSYKNYSQLKQQDRLQKQNRAQQQYSRFMKQKSASY